MQQVAVPNASPTVVLGFLVLVRSFRIAGRTKQEERDTGRNAIGIFQYFLRPFQGIRYRCSRNRGMPLAAKGNVTSCDQLFSPARDSHCKF